MATLFMRNYVPNFSVTEFIFIADEQTFCAMQNVSATLFTFNQNFTALAGFAENVKNLLFSWA